MASACIKSILPFKYALLENSPLLANLAPFFMQVLIILFIINKPPWQFISKEFSPVKELGATYVLIITSSIISLSSTILP